MPPAITCRACERRGSARGVRRSPPARADTRPPMACLLPIDDKVEGAEALGHILAKAQLAAVTRAKDKDLAGVLQDVT